MKCYIYLSVITNICMFQNFDSSPSISPVEIPLYKMETHPSMLLIKLALASANFRLSQTQTSLDVALFTEHDAYVALLS
jgi:hypothetical protein